MPVVGASRGTGRVYTAEVAVEVVVGTIVVAVSLCSTVLSVPPPLLTVSLILALIRLWLLGTRANPPGKVILAAGLADSGGSIFVEFMRFVPETKLCEWFMFLDSERRGEVVRLWEEELRRGGGRWCTPLIESCEVERRFKPRSCIEAVESNAVSSEEEEELEKAEIDTEVDTAVLAAAAGAAESSEESMVRSLIPRAMKF